MSTPLQSIAHKATWHPRLNEAGQKVLIQWPSQPSPVDAWSDPHATAAVLPDGALPTVLNGVTLAPWTDAPATAEGWEALANAQAVPEPPIDSPFDPHFDPPAGRAPAAGVVVLEPDGRLWLVCPSNRFGGYDMTFPKGRLEGKSLQATALVEAHEESGLQVRLLRHLVDVTRTQTHTRYYLAERIGGTPAAMGWETQCVMLVPPTTWPTLKLQSPDRVVLQALLDHLKRLG